MGFAIAEELANRGAEVILITGPVHISTKHSNITRINVRSAQQMHDCCLQHFSSCDAAILSAAVADFTPIQIADKKIKEKNESITITLKPNPDIAKTLGSLKTSKQIIVGFALETHNAIEHAYEKLHRKKFDFIVLNSLEDAGAGFGHDTNKICIIDTEKTIETFELKQKNMVAKDIINKLAHYFD